MLHLCPTASPTEFFLPRYQTSFKHLRAACLLHDITIELGMPLDIATATEVAVAAVATAAHPGLAMLLA